MASLDEMEGDAVELIVVAIAAILLIVIWSTYGSLSAMLKALIGGGGAGAGKSLANAAQGFPSGADPGTVPLFQYAQGVAESYRTLSDWLTPVPDYSAQEQAALQAESDQILQNYQYPSASELTAGVTGLSTSLSDWFNTATTNPQNLYFGQSPLF